MTDHDAHTATSVASEKSASYQSARDHRTSTAGSFIRVATPPRPVGGVDAPVAGDTQAIPVPQAKRVSTPPPSGIQVEASAVGIAGQEK